MESVVPAPQAPARRGHFRFGSMCDKFVVGVLTPKLLRPLVRSERARMSLTDAGRGLPLPLPSRRNWITGLAAILGGVVLASIAWQQLAAVRHLRGGAGLDLPTVLHGTLIAGLSVAALLLLLLAIALLSFRESAHLADNQLIHVVRFGPVRAVTAYDLIDVRNLRAVDIGKAGARIRFDYAHREQGLGDEMPLAEAEKRVKMIQTAIDGVSARRPSQSGPRPSQSGPVPPRPTPRP
jgi:hypothetical protein